MKSTLNQQACATMKEIVKEHPLRPIILRFDTQKTPLDLETQALNAYYRQHDLSWTAKRNLLQHQTESEEIDQTISKLSQQLLPISEQTSMMEAGFKLRDDVDALHHCQDPIDIHIGDYYHAVETHNKALQALCEKVVVETHWYNDWADFIYEHEDWFDEENEKGDELIHALYRNYDKVSVDIISFDRDQQEFFGSVSEIRKLQNRYFEFTEFVFKRYRLLQSDSEALYQRALRIKKYVDEHFG